MGGALWRLEKAPGRAGADRLRPGGPVAAESVTCGYFRTILAIFGVARPQETYRGQASGLQPRADWNVEAVSRSGALVSTHSRWVRSFGAGQVRGG